MLFAPKKVDVKVLLNTDNYMIDYEQNQLYIVDFLNDADKINPFIRKFYNLFCYKVLNSLRENNIHWNVFPKDIDVVDFSNKVQRYIFSYEDEILANEISIVKVLREFIYKYIESLPLNDRDTNRDIRNLVHGLLMLSNEEIDILDSEMLSQAIYEMPELLSIPYKANMSVNYLLVNHWHKLDKESRDNLIFNAVSAFQRCIMHNQFYVRNTIDMITTMNDYVNGLFHFVNACKLTADDYKHLFESFIGDSMCSYNQVSFNQSLLNKDENILIIACMLKCKYKNGFETIFKERLDKHNEVEYINLYNKCFGYDDFINTLRNRIAKNVTE